MVFGGSRSLNRVSFSPKFVSAKIAGCKHPVKRKTNDLSKLKYCQSDIKLHVSVL